MNRSAPCIRIQASRLTGWLCLLAVWLQVLLPVALHSTALADIPSLIVADADEGDDDGCALEQDAGHDHDDDHDHDGIHAHGGCLACQAMHFMAGGFAASALAIPAATLVQTVAAALRNSLPPRGLAVPRFFQARAPPVPSI